MKIAITAASGQLGTAIVKAVTEYTAKENIIALARTPEKASHLGVEVRPGDYNDIVQLEQSLKDVDSLLIVSGMDAPEKRIEQHRNVINAAKRAGVKKLVYTSIQGEEKDGMFSPVVQSNRQTEKDIQESGLEWVIGRNGIYIEPDVEYIETYKKLGGIFNCADNGKCGYTTRSELGHAYARMLIEDKHNSKNYNLHGETITQAQLSEWLNLAFGTHLKFESMSVENYKQDRIAELGDFIGTVITGIYQGIREGKFNNPSHFEQVTGRPHTSWKEFFTKLGNVNNH